MKKKLIKPKAKIKNSSLVLAYNNECVNSGCANGGCSNAGCTNHC
ncbi:hypothetical protein [Sutcliffiella rhizosphaerae]|nr:hypothetical protein [Sutcliffiella rhizosphaerae]